MLGTHMVCGARYWPMLTVVLIVAMGDATSARPVGAAGSTEADDHRSQHSAARRSGTAARGTATHDTSWCGPDHGAGLCVDSRESETFPVWQTNRKLLG